MRINILTAGLVILVAGYLLDYSGNIPFFLTGPVGLLNIVLGAITPRNPGVTLPSDRSSLFKLLVDKGVVGASTYELVFLEDKLILKKLSSRSLTVIVPLILAMSGLLFVNLVGAAMYGLTGFSLQEYVTQRRRDRINRQALLTTIARGDLEFPYDQLSKIEIVRNRLQLLSAERIVRIGLPRRYSAKIRPALRNIGSSKYQVDS